jgi:hypothetical protein
LVPGLLLQNRVEARSDAENGDTNSSYTQTVKSNSLKSAKQKTKFKTCNGFGKGIEKSNQAEK